MPQYSYQYPARGDDLNDLTTAFHEFQRRGPLITAVEVAVPDLLVEALTKVGLPVPPPAIVVALIDTGASISGFDQDLAHSLGLHAINSIPVSTPSGNCVQNVYGVKVSFPGTQIPTMPFLNVTGSVLVPQGIGMLLGRDFLADKVLIYNGQMRLYTLCC